MSEFVEMIKIIWSWKDKVNLRLYGKSKRGSQKKEFTLISCDLFNIIKNFNPYTSQLIQIKCSGQDGEKKIDLLFLKKEERNETQVWSRPTGNFQCSELHFPHRGV